MMLLTDEERRKFAAYLKQNAESGRLIIEQFEKVGGVASMLVAREKQKCAAYLIVARELDATESFTVGEE
jgi:hypothetical protein